MDISNSENKEQEQKQKKVYYIKKKKELTPEEKQNKLKEQRARYALNYYRKRVETDPEYSKILNERTKKNTAIRKGTDPNNPVPVGRPRKY
jgi:hypothetical protein